MGKGKSLAPHRADTRGGGWTGIPHVVQGSAAFRALTDRSVRVLLEIVREFNGGNNGRIGISTRTIADRLGIQNFSSISKAIAQIMEHGLIDIAAEGSWQQRLAREYRLTFVSTTSGGGHRPATNDYLQWRPSEKSAAETVSAASARSADTSSSACRKSAETVSARIAATRRKTAIPVNVADETVSSHILKPYPQPPIVRRAGGDGDRGATESIENPAADHSALVTDSVDIDQVSRSVRASLIDVRKSRGRLGLAGIASTAGVDSDRLIAFVEGRDGLSGPTILRLRRDLPINGSAAA